MTFAARTTRTGGTWPHLVRLTLERKVLSREQELQQRRKGADSVSGNTEAEKIRAATACAQAENALREARAEFDAKSSVLIDVRGESWEAITPHELLPAVANVRGDFEKLGERLQSSTEQHCFQELHHVGPGQVEPAIFKQHFWNGFQWQSGELVQIWSFTSDWTAPGLQGDFTEPVFHAVLANGYIYVPGAGADAAQQQSRLLHTPPKLRSRTAVQTLPESWDLLSYQRPPLFRDLRLRVEPHPAFRAVFFNQPCGLSLG